MAIENVIYNTRAIIEMKTEMDYVTALSYLFKALEIDDSIGNMASRWTHLYNISTLYYFRDLYALVPCQSLSTHNIGTVVKRLKLYKELIANVI